MLYLKGDVPVVIPYIGTVLGSIGIEVVAVPLRGALVFDGINGEVPVPRGAVELLNGILVDDG